MGDKPKAIFQGDVNPGDPGVITIYDSEPMHGSGPITRAEMTCVKCGTVFSIWNETAQAIHFETGLCKACIRGK